MTRPEDRNRRIRVAYGSVPKDGGTFTFYRNTRPALSDRGIDMFCVTLGWAQNQLWNPAFVDENSVRLGRTTRSLKQQAKLFTQWCADQEIDIAIGINSEGILSALPHLSPETRVVARCANAFDEGYRVTMAGRDRLAAIVALTPRLRDDLVRDYGADPELISLIPNGIDLRGFDDKADRQIKPSDRLEIVFLGRLEHTQKGVLYIPDIVRELAARNIPFRLRIAGQGRDEPKLRDALAADVDAGRVEFLGAINARDVPAYLASGDVFLFTSHFEGCPNTLLEAMVSGCIPVAGQIDGITDFLIDDGRNGYLCPLGDAGAFVDRIEALAQAPEQRGRMHEAIRSESRARFANTVAAEKYAEIFRNVMEQDQSHVSPLPWSRFQPHENFRGYWRQNVPPGLKKTVKAVLGR